MTSREEVVIVCALRTPIAKARKGKFRNLKNDELVTAAIRGVIEKTGINPNAIEEVILGHCLSSMEGSLAARMGALRAGVPVETPVMTVNRLCASGMESIGLIAEKIRSGKIDIGLAGGFESMSSHGLPKEYNLSRDGLCEDAMDCLLPFGEVSEMLSKSLGITRIESDEYALTSQKRALDATKRGCFTREVIPMRIGGESVKDDEGIRETSLEVIRNLKPVFRDDGICTSANSSQLSDGASAILLMRRKKADELGLPVIAEFVDLVVTGLKPRDMGLGPVAAIEKLLERNNLKKDEISCFEINEAFASQVLCCLQRLGIDRSKVNKYGGAIALGHPLGASGARIVCTLLNVMENESSGEYGVASLCVGSGYGIAALFKKCY
ncbi:acetyl-CoA C-acyltransferase [Encephalitozoon hellem ATCC 50504]|uniref:acetyl-CoA C-acyltransferase n=1 Tax=Encephalitozoon hellem TaxID=27973 RepID=A0A9Q9C8E7_ENCHE|nr:acetyl-CoA C-acyltransferase [Encephalitozoon hellem ATCC 50504]AFM98460.1 acetyl-CoA C-acyltransferase [Encephalitozoon hellem ATCC 50504]UTX43385.1 3-ketoacyl-CoA thiolase, peroxisomal [Encephalitozoon hellem]|eukprot:XP_003887441.1 acetyl-CoA C-acyltransferase [Encephalitozoon hellem ATCC 50504]